MCNHLSSYNSSITDIEYFPKSYIWSATNLLG